MDPNLLKQAMADAKAVRTQAFNNAQHVMNQTIQNAMTIMTYGWRIEDRDDKVIRYKYTDWGKGVVNAMEEIEKNGYVILDENEEECWIDVIKSEDLTENVVNNDAEHLLASTLSEFVTEEIDKEIVDQLVAHADKMKKLKNMYYKFKSHLKNPLGLWMKNTFHHSRNG